MSDTPIVDALTDAELVDKLRRIVADDDSSDCDIDRECAAAAARIEALVREVAELTKCVTCGWRNHEHAPDCPQVPIDAATGGKVEGERSTGGGEPSEVAGPLAGSTAEPNAPTRENGRGPSSTPPPTPPPAVAPEPDKCS